MSAWVELLGKFAKTEDDIMLFSEAMVEIQEREYQKTLAQMSSWFICVANDDEPADNRFGPFEVVVRDVDTDADDSIPAVATALHTLLEKRKA